MPQIDLTLPAIVLVSGLALVLVLRLFASWADAQVVERTQRILTEHARSLRNEARSTHVESETPPSDTRDDAAQHREDA